MANCSAPMANEPKKWPHLKVQAVIQNPLICWSLLTWSAGSEKKFMESTNFFGVCILKIWHLYYKTKSQCYVCQPVVCCCMLFWHLRSQKYSSFQHRCLLFVQTSTTYQLHWYTILQCNQVKFLQCYVYRQANLCSGLEAILIIN